MADYCKQCCIHIFGGKTGDLAKIAPKDGATNALCEGCGEVIMVDYDGKRVSGKWLAPFSKEWKERLAQNMPSQNVTCKCGHEKKDHIYEEGACRPGFKCSSSCEQYVPAGSFKEEK